MLCADISLKDWGLIFDKGILGILIAFYLTGLGKWVKWGLGRIV